MKFQPLRDFLDNYLPRLGVPGSDTLVYHKGKEIFRYQSGYGDLEKKTPVNPNGLYNLYSCTKVATMCTLLTLLERGEIHLYDPVYAYLPAYRELTVRFQKENGEWDVRPAQTVMTIRHLMSMCSGMDYDMNAPAIQEVYKATDGRCPTLQTVNAMAKKPLQFDPGTNFKYSLSHDVIGGVIEVVSGKPFGQYMREVLLDPIGMYNTTFKADDSIFARMNKQYRLDKEHHCAIEKPVSENVCRFGSEYESGGGGLISCVDDYILLTEMLTHKGVAPNGERILADATVELLRTNVLAGKALDSFHRIDPSRTLGYGYGLGVRVMMEPAEGGSLSSVGEFGWDGAAHSYLSADPLAELSIFHAEHMSGGLHEYINPRLRNVVYACVGK